MGKAESTTWDDFAFEAEGIVHTVYDSETAMRLIEQDVLRPETIITTYASSPPLAIPAIEAAQLKPFFKIPPAPALQEDETTQIMTQGAAPSPAPAGEPRSSGVPRSGSKGSIPVPSSPAPPAPVPVQTKPATASPGKVVNPAPPPVQQPGTRGHKKGSKKWILWLLILATAGLLIYDEWFAEEEGTVAWINRQSTILTSPDANAPPVQRLERGTSVRASALKEPGWMRVRLSADVIGYLPESVLSAKPPPQLDTSVGGRRKLVRKSIMYSRYNEQSLQIDRYRKGTSFDVIGRVVASDSDGRWVEVIRNGQIGYIEAADFGIRAQDGIAAGGVSPIPSSAGPVSAAAEPPTAVPDMAVSPIVAPPVAHSPVQPTAETRTAVQDRCTAMTSNVSILLCQNRHLRDMNGRMESAYQAAIRRGVSRRDLGPAPEAWRASNNDCQLNISCLQQAFDARIDELSTMTAPTETVFVVPRPPLQSRIPPPDGNAMVAVVEPKPRDKEQWIREADYPKKALSRGIEGRLEYELDVDPDGNAKGCRILRSTGYEDLDAETCWLLLNRAKFVPALNGSNVRVPGQYRGKIAWRLDGR
jgi:TonB family protein